MNPLWWILGINPKDAQKATEGLQSATQKLDEAITQHNRTLQKPLDELRKNNWHHTLKEVAK